MPKSALSLSGKNKTTRVNVQVLVTVDWAVPNYRGNLITYIGGGDQMNFAGTALSAIHHEIVMMRNLIDRGGM